MDRVLEALYITWPLWAFLSILAVSLFVEEGVIAHNKRKMVDNPTLW